MNKKITMGAAVSLAIMFAAVTFITTMIYSARIFDSKMSDIKKRETIYAKLNEVDLYVRENYFGDINENTLLDNIIRGYITGIGDQYGIYLTADEYAKITSNEEGKLVDIGLIPVQDVDGYIKVQEVYEESPAAVAGIEIGDLIVKVGDIAVTSETYNEAVEALKGEPGTQITLRTRKEANDKDIEVTRRKVEVPTVESRIIDNVGYIRIKEFNDNTIGQFQRVIAEMLQVKVAGIVFDVRSNPGGTMNSVTQILDILLPEGPIVSATYRDGSTEVIAESDSSYVDLPMTVLINDKTASAAELFAQALKDYNMANTVGITTVGKGSMQNIKKLNDGSALDITIAQYNPPKSENFQGIGIKPDYEIRMSHEMNTNFHLLDEYTDLQLRKALELLGVQIKNNENLPGIPVEEVPSTSLPPIEEDEEEDASTDENATVE